RIGAVLRRRRQLGQVGEQAVAGADVRVAPARRSGGWLVEVVHQAGDLRLVQHVGVGGHLAGRAAFADHLVGLGGLDPAEALRQQRRAGTAETVGAVAALAVLFVQRLGI